MVQAARADVMAYEKKIHNSRAVLIEDYIDLIKKLDEQAEWAMLVNKAREAGLGKEELQRETSYSWSTVIRWSAGHTAPGQFARTALKAKFIELLDSMRQQESRLASEPEYA